MIQLEEKESISVIEQELTSHKIKILNKEVFKQLWTYFLNEGASSQNVERLMEKVVQPIRCQKFRQYLLWKEEQLRKCSINKDETDAKERIKTFINSYSINDKAQIFITSFYEKNNQIWDSIIEEYMIEEGLDNFKQDLMIVFERKNKNKTLQQIISEMVNQEGNQKNISQIQNKANSQLAFKSTIQNVNEEKQDKYEPIQKNIQQMQREQSICSPQQQNQIEQQVNIYTQTIIDFNYQEKENKDKHVLFIIISDKKIKKIYYSNKSIQAYNQVNRENYTYFQVQNNIHSYFYKFPISFHFLSLSLFSLKVEYQKFLFSTDTVVYNKLQEIVRWSKNKGVIFLFNNISNSKRYEKTSLLQSSIYLCRAQKYYWYEIRRWWYLINNQYHLIQNQSAQTNMEDILSCIKVEKNQVIEIKYFIWLLASIFKSKIYIEQSFSLFFKKIVAIPLEYKYQTDFESQELQTLQKVYLRCLLYGQFESKRISNILKLNQIYQNKYVKKQITMLFTAKWIQLFEKCIADYYISNDLFSVQEFVSQFLNKFIHVLQEFECKNKNTIVEYQSKILNIFDYLLCKCRYNYEHGYKKKFSQKLLTNNSKESQIFQNILFSLNHQQVRKLRLSFGNKLALLLTIIKDIWQYQPKLSQFIINLLQLNQMKLKECFAKDLYAFFDVIVKKPINEDLLKKMIQYLSSTISHPNIAQLIDKNNIQQIQKIIDFLISSKNQLINFTSLINIIERALRNRIPYENQLQQKFKSLLDICSKSISKSIPSKETRPMPITIPVSATLVPNINPVQIIRDMPNSNIEVIPRPNKQIQPYIPQLKFPLKPVKKISILIVFVCEQQFESLKTQQLLSKTTMIQNYNNYRCHFFLLSNIQQKILTTQPLQFIGPLSVLRFNVEKIDIIDQCGLLWIQNKQLDALTRTYFGAHSLTLLSNDYVKQIRQMRVWFKLISRKINKIQSNYLQNIILKVFSLFKKKQQNSGLQIVILNQITYYSILKLINFLFPSNLQLIQNQQIWKNVDFLKLKNNFSFQGQMDSDQMKEQNQILKLHFINTSYHQMKGSNMTINAITNNLKQNLKHNTNINKKYIIGYIIEKKMSKIFIDADLQLTKDMINNSCFDWKQYLIAKLLYEDSLIQRRSIKNSEQLKSRILLFIKNLIQKCKNKNHYQNQIQIKKNSSLLSQELRSIFLTKSMKQFGSSQNKETFIFNDFTSFFGLYKNLKLIDNQNLYDLIIASIRKQFIQMINKTLQNEKQFKNALMLIAKNCQNSAQLQTLQLFLSKKQLNSYFCTVLEIAFCQIDINQQFLFEIILQALRKGSQLSLFRQDILKCIVKIYNESADDKSIFMNFYKEILKIIRIDQSDFVSYLSKSKILTVNELRCSYLNKTIHQIMKASGKQHLQQNLYDMMNRAFKQMQYQISQISQNQRNLKMTIKTQIIRIFVSILDQQESRMQEIAKIWQIIQSNKYLQYYRLKYDSTWDSTFDNFNNKLKEHEYYGKQIKALYDNKSNISRFIKIKEFILTIDRQYKYFNNKIKQLQNLLVIFKNFELLDTQTEQLDETFKQIQELKCRQILQIAKKYEGISQYGEQIKLLMNLNYWRKQQITDKDKLLSEYQKTIGIFRGNVQKLEKLSYEEFKQTFLPLHKNNLQTLISPNHQKIEKIKLMMEALNTQKIKLLGLTLESVIFIKKQWLKNKQIIVEQHFQMFHSLYLKIKEQNQQSINLQQLMQVSKKVADQFKKIGLDWQNQKQNGQIIRNTYLCRELFAKIQEKGVNRKNLDQIQEYINQIQNSIIKLDIIRDFRIVTDYWNYLKNCQNFGKVIQYVNNVYDLAKKIIDSHGSMSAFFQKLQESSDRTSSFKFQVQKILKQSIVRIIDCQDGSVELQIQTNQNQIINFKRLSLFKQKSMLVNFKQNTQSEEDRSNKLQMLNSYCQLFDHLASIRGQCLLLVRYGYDVKLLVNRFFINQRCYDQIINAKNNFEQLKTQWITKIRQIYSESFVLSHFVGVKLVQFIEAIINKVYYPSLAYFVPFKLKQQKMIHHRRLQGFSQEQFYQWINEERNVNLIQQAKVLKPLDKVKKIQQLFRQFDQPAMEEQIEFKNKIILITSQIKYIYANMFKQNDNALPGANQVLFCHKGTLIQELELFIYRALIKIPMAHFIVGANKLDEAVQKGFCNFFGKIKVQKMERFQRSKIIFIDDNQSNSIFSFLCKPKNFNIQRKFNDSASQNSIEEANVKMIQLLEQTIVISSSKAGLGKTYNVESIGKKRSTKQRVYNVYHFPIGGNINFVNLGQRLKDFVFTGNEILLLKLGSVQNLDDLQIFLTSLILFRCFYSEQYIYLSPFTSIYIQIQNIFHPINNIPLKKSNIINHLIKSNLHINIQNFDSTIINFQNLTKEQQFVYIYLQLLNTKNILTTNHLFSQIQKLPHPSNSKKLQLIQLYYLRPVKAKNLMPTFLLYKNAMKMFFYLFQTFSKNTFLQADNLKFSQIQLVQSYRLHFIQICIQNVQNLLQETFTQNLFMERANQQNFKLMIKKFSMLILPQFEKDGYKFVYQNDNQVPLAIKVYNISQNMGLIKQLHVGISQQKIENIFSQLSFRSIKDKILLERQMLDILFSVSKQFKTRPKVNGQLSEDQEKIIDGLLKQYALTKDNFFKMCLIIQRAKCGIPCVIEGESGVGKTALITFLVKNILQAKLLTFNIHAGIHLFELTKIVQQITEQANKLNQQCKFIQSEKKSVNNKLWVFFDQFNTTQELAYIKQMVTENRFLGKQLPQNIIIITACNPYRHKKDNKHLNVGLASRNILTRQQRDKKLAFLVQPPPFTMIQFMWDYQQLTREETVEYVFKMLKNVQYQNKQNLIEVILKLHDHIKTKIDESAVSLRDIARFKQLEEWFFSYFNNIQQIKQMSRRSTINMEQKKRKSVVFALYFCYCLRFQNTNDRMQVIKKICNELKLDEKNIIKVIEEEQKYFVSQLNLINSKIALNKALIQNVFSTFVCVINHIPILIIGNPGSSKSMAVHILASNLNGKSSNSPICRHYPQINMIYFQGSESSTSAGIQQVFQKANRSISQKYECLNCIYFDEIGLAQKSVHNPLKVLHGKLQISSQKIISFIGISNWELDAAKMSRFLIVVRQPPNINSLQQTAGQLYQKYTSSINPTLKKQIMKMGEYYFKFITKWEDNHRNKAGFFGLRDFYNYVKYVCKSALIKGTIKIQEQIDRAIQINFDGEEKSCECFKQIANAERRYPSMREKKIMNPISLVQQNLQNNDSRCLLLIVKGDSLVPIIKSSIQNKNVIVIYGSSFSQDQKSQQYNLQVTNRVIAHMAKGEIVAFKDINNSIQSSLYDLFNKVYYLNGNNYYCRIAVGANSNPQCLVHKNFNAIVFIQQNKVRLLDPPFLNRFQKHYLTIKSTLSEQQITTINKHIANWVNQIIRRKKNNNLQKQNYIMNCSQQSIVTLIIKHRNIQQIQQRLVRIKTQILQNKTIDFILLYNQQCIQTNECIQQLQYLIPRVVPIEKCTDDLIIYTYDQYVHIQERSNHQLLRNCQKIKISQINSQKRLKQEIQKGLKEKDIAIILHFPAQMNHLQQILFLSKRVKEQIKSNHRIIVIVQLYRFSFVRHNEKEVNVSYLHNFQQYFLESFQVDISALINSCSNYQQLCLKLGLEQKLPSMYTEALSLIKIKLNSLQKCRAQRQYFTQLVNMYFNSRFKQDLTDFLQKMLSSLRIDFSVFQANQQQINLCSDINQALVRQTTNIILKCIILFLKFIVQRNYKDFYLEHNMMTEQEQQTQKIFISLIFKQDVQRMIHQESENKLMQINMQKQSNQFVYQESNLFLYAIDIFFKDIRSKWIEDRNLKNIINQEGQKNSHFNLFELIFEQKSKQYSAINQILNQSKLHCFLIHDAIKSLIQVAISDEELNIITKFIDKKIKCKIGYKLFLIICNQGKFFFNFIIKIILTWIIYFKNPIKLLNQLQAVMCFDTTNRQNNLKDIAQNLLDKSINLSLLTMQNFYQIKQNCIYEYIKQINFIINQNYIQDNQAININKNFYLSKKFYELLQSIENNEDISYVSLFVGFKQNESLFDRIYQFTQKMMNYDPNKQKYYKFLSYSFFESWIVYSIDTDDQNSINNCISIFINWCNNHPTFANRSITFFQSVFNNMNNKFNISDIIQHLTNNKRFSIIQKYLNPSSYFTIALSNYFYSESYKIIIHNTKDDNKSDVYILDLFFEEFRIFSQENNQLESIADLFKISFLKQYLVIYINALKNRKDKNLLLKIDNILSQESTLTKHLRIFSLKILMNDYTKIQIINQFIKCKSCKWILLEQTIFMEKQSFKTAKIDIPQEIINNFNLFKNSLFQGQRQFNNLISAGLKSQEMSYGLLSIFLTKIYFQLSQSIKIKIINLINKQNKLKIAKLQCFTSLLLAYCQGYITKGYQLGKIKQQADQQKQYLKQIPLLNYLNIIISASIFQVKSPLLDMFFEYNKSSQSFSKRLQQRFLIGSIQNPAISKINYFLRNHKKGRKANSYLLCSQNCDYMNPIGGNFYGVSDGCMNPTSVANCPYCNKLIGAKKEFNLLEGNSIISPQHIEGKKIELASKASLSLNWKGKKEKIMLTGLRKCRILNEIKNYQENKRDLLNAASQNLQSEKIMIYHYILQSVIYIVWAFLCERSIISKEDAKSCFGFDKDKKINYFDKIIQFYEEQTKSQLKFNDAQFTFWNIGVAQKLRKTIFESSIKANNNPNYEGLKHSLIRDEFQSDFQTNIQQITLNQIERQKQILTHLVQLDHNSFDILSERTDQSLFTRKYQWISLFKNIKMDQNLLLEKYEDMIYSKFKQNCLQLVQKQYPLLNILLQSLIKDADKFNMHKYLRIIKIILCFLSKIKHRLNFKMRRIDKNNQKQTITKIIQQIAQNQIDYNQLQNEFKQFKQCWNKLASLSHQQMSIGCLFFTQLLPIQNDSPIKRLLLIDHKQNKTQGNMLTAIIAVFAKIYNNICITYNTIAQTEYPGNNFLLKKKIDPTDIDSKVNLLEFFEEQDLKNIIVKYSHLSVEQGISHYEFQLSEIQFCLVKNQQNISLLEENSQYFNYIQFIAENNHFLMEMKSNPRNETLVQINKKNKVDEYFKDQRKKQVGIFHKIIKDIQRSLDIVMVYCKNIEETNLSMTLQNFIQKQQIVQNAKILKEEPFRSISLSALVDLYEYIELLTFQDLQNHLNSDHKHKMQKNLDVQLTKALKIMKQSNVPKGFPTYDQFKRAIYRFVGRNVVPFNVAPSQTIQQHICNLEFYWDNQTILKQLSDEFKKLIRIPISNLGQVLNRLPFQEQRKVSGIFNVSNKPKFSRNSI